MKNVISLGMLFLVFMVTACGDRSESHTMRASTTVSVDTSTHATSSLPSATMSNSTSLSNFEKQDDSIRAIGFHPDGRLLVIPASKASVAPLGAPSCKGRDADLRNFQLTLKLFNKMIHQ